MASRGPSATSAAVSLTGRAPEQVLSLAPGHTLSVFNRAGVLNAAEVHVALRLARLAGEQDELVALALALAVRAPRYGHVLADLSTVASCLAGWEESGAEIDPLSLPWPALEAWTARLASSPLVAVGDDVAGAVPLRLVGTSLYLARFWEEERMVASSLLDRARGSRPPVDTAVLAEGVLRLFGPSGVGPMDEQARAAEMVVSQRLAVIAGGPGTGKTTTIARAVALVLDQALASGSPPPLVALAAPTGKAAARLAEAVHQEAATMPLSAEARSRLMGLGASTVHRLLGRHPASANRFRHDRFDRLPHDLVVVDETSMMSLSMMASLLEATSPHARLVLVGDPEQLASVEAGAVLGDIVAPALTSTEAASPLAGCICLLNTNYRFGGPLAELARAVRSGDIEATVQVLRTAPGASASNPAPPLRWLPVDAASADDAALSAVREMACRAGADVARQAQRGEGAAALAAAARFRVLCAHRHGPAGASTWNSRVEGWLAAEGVAGAAGGEHLNQWYVGRPVMVTANDYSVGLFNGDLGVTVARPAGGLGVAFQRPTDLAVLSPSRLSAVETAYAMTAHRAQGSEFEDVVVVLPDAGSRILTRELLYTAVTRARRGLLLVGPEASVRAAVGRPVARASGLTARLWSAK